MLFSAESRGFDEQGRVLRNIIQGVEHPDPVLASLGTELADLWRKNIMAGPTGRWEAGPSRRALAQGGNTLYDRGDMFRSITGAQTGPNEITVGSTLTVGSRGWNLLAIHEFGATVRAVNAPFLTFRYPLSGVKGGGWARKEVRIPRRPTSPYDFQAAQMTPEADTLIQSRVGNYLVQIAA